MNKELKVFPRFCPECGGFLTIVDVVVTAKYDIYTGNRLPIEYAFKMSCLITDCGDSLCDDPICRHYQQQFTNVSEDDFRLLSTVERK